MCIRDRYQYSCDEEESYNILTPVDLQFDDVSQISQWALDGVRYAYTNGLISGMDDDTFRPCLLYTSVFQLHRYTCL